MTEPDFEGVARHYEAARTAGKPGVVLLGEGRA
jgi:hypothetical protein